MPPRRARRPLLPFCLILLLVAGFQAGPLAAQDVYPGRSWAHVASPEAAGFSSEGLKAARDYAATINTEAVMIVAGGRVVDEWGPTSTRFNIHSIRKSLLSALYGIHVADGEIDLSKTMGDLGIDDNAPSLTDEEKQATVHDLLKARLGVYHPALYETAAMAAARPPRHSHPPGTFWYYNNWDFNALGFIFEHLTKTDLFRDFQARLAEPIGMEDFRIEDTQYVSGADSVYPAYPFRLTAQGHGALRAALPAARALGLAADRAGGLGDRVGEVLLGRRPCPAATATCGGLPSMAGTCRASRCPDGSYSARGAGGHYILVIPAYDLVIVHRVNTDIQGRSVSSAEFGRLVKLILDARK